MLREERLLIEGETVKEVIAVINVVYTELEKGCGCVYNFRKRSVP